jgi:hypothetical protein
LKDGRTGASGRPVRGIAVTVLAATWLEAWAVRRAAPAARLVLSGIALRGLRAPLEGAVITCGLAGTWLACDPALVAALAAAARRIGVEPERGPVATTPVLVRGSARAEWAARGCVAAEMETGRLTGPRIATVRTILDTPAREISGVWQDPVRALVRPDAWGDVVWLGREAPRCARRAAAVLAGALAILANDTS